jgi:glyoxylase-like metal-dependent hydrolase (beta-lactamase superfamily II)
MSTSEVAPGVHHMSNAVVNWYLLEADGGLVVIDAGFPGDYDAFADAVRGLGRSLTDVRAVVITHAHVDHLGFADRVRREAGATVAVPEGDAELARHPLKAAKSERNPLLYVLRYGPTRHLYLTALRKNAIRAKLLGDVTTYADGDALPGGLVAVPTPGHTFGHTSLLLRERSVLFSGDALVTEDPYTGRTGPRLVARAATADSTMGKRSLDAIDATGAELVLPGHGDPWTSGAHTAAELARRAPVA